LIAADQKEAKVIDRLSKDLSEAFPDMKGFFPRNLGYIKRFAIEFSESSILQQGVAKLSWRRYHGTS
jgi:hypothetical protein